MGCFDLAIVLEGPSLVRAIILLPVTLRVGQPVYYEASAYSVLPAQLRTHNSELPWPIVLVRETEYPCAGPCEEIEAPTLDAAIAANLKELGYDF